MRRFGFILAFWVALTASVQSIGGLQGLVLCLSSRGHVALEMAHFGDPECDPNCDPTSSGAFDLADADSTVHPCCTDITLARIDLRTDRRGVTPESTERHDGPAATAVIPRAGPAIASASIPTDRDFRIAADAALRAHSRAIRTIILRT